ncbi:MAG: SDR family NAD(P)-dependent oxidoreductase [Flavobacteriales bacterium]|nr:SDR family NAD(P)-dependent oxidoreductase [Flavobacteriales bacterium]MCB9335273.1 SDR family NAD(P)-dependent oxidoreductase [Flavobacteriales bacterium]
MNILITGGSRGIGRELVLLFAANTNNKVVVFSRNQEKMKELEQECLEKFNNLIVSEYIDFLTNNLEDEIEKALKKINTSFNVVINNAGQLINGPFLQTEVKDIEESFKVNFTAPYLINKNIAAKYAATNCHIVNIGSMGGVQGSVKFPGLSVYSASKAALANLTECLAEELKETGIKVNCLALGSAQTEMLHEAFPGYESPVSAKDMAQFIYQFSLTCNKLFNGKIIPVAITTP